jgi:predicted small lipoprotein YifL
MRKFLLMLFLLIPTFTLAACGDDELPDDGEDIEEIEEEDEIGDGEIDDE